MAGLFKINDSFLNASLLVPDPLKREKTSWILSFVFYHIHNRYKRDPALSR